MVEQTESGRTWSGVARGLHWSMAVLIVAQAAIGLLGDKMEHSPARIDVMTAHKSLGVTLLLLLLFRLAWRWATPPPPPPAGSARWEIVGARLSHALLYLAMFGLMLAGWVAAATAALPWKLWWILPGTRILAPDKALHDQAGLAHYYLFWLLVALLVAHVAAALRHHFIKRNDVLSAMWRGD